MFSSKRYGQGKMEKCPFCGKSAILANEQGIAVCASHKDETLDDLRCACGRSLELKHSSFGPFFVCMECGAVSLRKALDINDVKPSGKKDDHGREVSKDADTGVDSEKRTETHRTIERLGPSQQSTCRQETVRSDDPRYFD